MQQNGQVKIDGRAARRVEVAAEQRARTRAAIIDATFRVLGHEHGRMVRIEDVAKEAKIARPTFYTYFNSMEQLFAALSYELSQQDYFRLLSSQSKARTAGEELATAVRYHILRAQADPQWGWGMVNLSVGGPLLGAETHQAAEVTVGWGMETGEFKLPAAQVGRDIVLGAGVAAMKTVLAGKVDKSFADQVARQVLIAMGLTAAKADKLIAQPMPPLKHFKPKVAAE